MCVRANIYIYIYIYIKCSQGSIYICIYIDNVHKVLYIYIKPCAILYIYINLWIFSIYRNLNLETCAQGFIYIMCTRFYIYIMCTRLYIYNVHKILYYIMSTRFYIYIYIMSTRLYMYIMCTRLYIYIYIYTHTHIHTHPHIIHNCYMFRWYILANFRDLQVWSMSTAYMVNCHRQLADSTYIGYSVITIQWWMSLRESSIYK